MSQEKSFILAFKFFISDIGSAFSDLFRSLPLGGSRGKQLDKVMSKLNRLTEKLERIEEKIDKSTYENNSNGSKDRLNETRPKFGVTQPIKEKIDEIKTEDSEWVSETSALFVADKDREWVYKASELLLDLDHDPEPEPEFPNSDWDPYSNYLKEIENKQYREMKKRVEYLKGEDCLERMEEIKLMIEMIESFFEKKQQEVDKHEKNFQIYEGNLAKLKEEKSRYTKHSLQYGSGNQKTYKNIKHQILNLENTMDIVGSEISSAKVRIECKQKEVENLKAELLLLEMQKKEEE